MRWARAAALVLVIPAVAPASEPASPRRPAGASATTPAGPDVSFGGSFLRSGEADLYGFQASVSLPLRHSVRFVGDLSVHKGSFAGADLKQVTFLAGARVPWRAGRRLRPFGQILVGGSRTTSTFAPASLSSSDTAWGGAGGAGVDYRLSRRWALRGEGDYLVLHSGGGWDADPRLTFGAVNRFGR